MIEFAKITGEMDGHRIQVTMRTGESLYAPITVMGTDVSVPSKEWFATNKDNFMALVTYEKDILLSPMVIGFFPVAGADSSSYNTTERLLSATLQLLEQLLKAKVNTMIGPQPFMPDTIQVFTTMKQELEEIQKLILPLKL